MGTRPLTWATLVATVALVLGGCKLFATRYPAPPDPLQPTTVGVVAVSTQDASGYHDRLVDGRMVDMPQNGVFKLMGGISRPGDLLLAGTTDGDFATALSPSGPGCWEAWQAPGEYPIVWDLGSSILFVDGVDLPKAAGFHADPLPQKVDGRLAWTQPYGDGAEHMTFCANQNGEIESALEPGVR